MREESFCLKNLRCVFELEENINGDGKNDDVNTTAIKCERDERDLESFVCMYIEL